MTTGSTFSRLAARPVDRVHIAASVVPGRNELYAIDGYEVSPGDAALVAPFLSREPMTWAQLRLPLRYPPEERVRARLDECVTAGVITFVDDVIAYTAPGSEAAVAVLDAQAAASQAMWSKSQRQVDELLELILPLADAATAAGMPSSQLVDQTLVATTPTPASELWRALAKVRRYRADCHAEAWAAAGHSVDSIVALPADAEERQPIEQRTDELNAGLWALLPEQDQVRFMACLASLDGAGTPT